MEEPTEFEDWELLHGLDTALCFTPKSADGAKCFEEIAGESDGNGAIKPEYFALDSGERYAKRAIPVGDTEGEGLADQPKGGLGFAGTESLAEDSDAFRSDDPPDGQSFPTLCQKGEVFREEDSNLEVGFQGIDAALNEEEPGETEDSKPDEFVRMEGGTEDPKTEVGFEGIDTRHHYSDNDAALRAAASAEIEKIEGSETGNEIHDELGSGESARMEDSTGSSCEGEKRGPVWLKLPLDLLKFCVVRVRPVWSISIAAGIIGILMLGRRLYKMKRKSRSIPLKVRIDDKKASQLMVHAARLNEAFSAVRRVPIIRSPPPAGGVTLWPVMGLL